MDILRKSFDYFYDTIKPLIFFATKKDPEIAHDLFINFCQFLHRSRLEKIILDNKTNKNNSFIISNAAGFNKNVEIPSSILKYLGFDRIVVGTITNEPWYGNLRPRITRYSKIESLVNNVGLSNDGAEKISERLSNYSNYDIPLTASITSTPNKKGKELLKDLEKTIICLRNNSNIDRFELDISCPNIKEKYQEQLRDILDIIKNILDKEIYLKISPDIEEKDIDKILSDSESYVTGFVTTNSSTDFSIFPYKNIKGGISGNALYNKSLQIQKLFYKKIKKENLKLIACGGINSIDKVKERLSFGASEIQIYTPLIFSGTKLLREFRNY